DGRLFAYVDDDPPTLGALLAFNPHIVEIPHVPDGTQVALQGCFVVNIAGSRVHSGQNRIPWDAAISTNVNIFNRLGGVGRGNRFACWTQQQEAEEDAERQRHHAAGALPTGFLKGQQNMSTFRAVMGKARLYGS